MGGIALAASAHQMPGAHPGRRFRAGHLARHLRSGDVRAEHTSPTAAPSTSASTRASTAGRNSVDAHVIGFPGGIPAARRSESITRAERVPIGQRFVSTAGDAGPGRIGAPTPAAS